jgi:hypothetical protein
VYPPNPYAVPPLNAWYQATARTVPRLVDSMAASITAASADQAIRKQRTHTYPIQVWYFLVWVIFLVAVLRLASRFHSKYARGRRSGNTNSEANGCSPSPSPHLRHIPLAIVNTYRIIVVRWAVQINVGTSYTLNIAEMALTFAYIIAIFTWTFINSTFCFPFCSPLYFYLHVPIVAHDPGLRSNKP